MKDKSVKPDASISIIRSIVVGFVLAFILCSLIVVGGKTYANYNTNTSIVSCKEEGYEKLIKSGKIDAAITTKAQVQENCETLKVRIEELLGEYSNNTNDFPLYITDFNTTFCGNHSLGCVTNGYKLNNNIRPVMSISYLADYYDLEHTVAHEYIHVLTSHEESEALYANPSIWGTVEPTEGVADCGASFFTKKEFTGGSYMETCSLEQVAIAQSVIDNTLVN